MNSSSPAAQTPAATTTGIVNGSIVAVRGTCFDGKQGLVIDANSDLCPEDGPIAVFFDKEIGAHSFADFIGADRWKDGVPTLENYRQCPRVICFKETNLKPLAGFSPLMRAIRIFTSDCVRDCSSPNFPLVPGKHACMFKGCEGGPDARATHSVLINVWGGVYEVYGCQACDKDWHGKCCDGFELKTPLPGQEA